MKLDLRRYLTPYANPWAVAGEALMLPLLAIGIGIWVHPIDPLWIHGDFPWIWLAPVILAMRYGPFPGLVSGFVLLSAWFAFSLSGWVQGEFPKLNFLGGLILVMLAGEFSSLWLARARRAEGVQIYLDQRLEYLTHQYYLLRLSHDRLEQDLIGRPMAMRDAIGILRTLTVSGGASRLPSADGLLRLFAQYCQIECAALYAATDGDIAPLPEATLGQLHNEHLDLSDPLVIHALETGSLSHIAQTADESNASSRYIIVSPLTDFSGQVLGLLAVERVPFFALHEEMLQTLNLMLGYYADGLATEALARDVRAEFPSCPADFAAELSRLSRVANVSGVDSVIVALEFKGRSEFDDISTHVLRQRRSLDINWSINEAEHRILVTLMPLSGSAAAEGYIARISEWIHQQYGASLTEKSIFPHVIHLENSEPSTVLHHLFEACHVPVETRSLRTHA